MKYCRKNRATSVMGLKTRTYNGKEISEFVGKVTINRKDYLLKIQSDGSNPLIYEAKKDGTPLIYLNVVDLGVRGQRTRRNEL